MTTKPPRAKLLCTRTVSLGLADSQGSASEAVAGNLSAALWEAVVFKLAELRLMFLHDEVFILFGHHGSICVV